MTIQSINKSVASIMGAAIVALGGSAFASGGDSLPLKHAHFSWEGMFGHYEQAQLQRGYQVYREVCASCHSMELVAFRHLGDKGAPYYMDSCPEVLGMPESADCSVSAQNPIVKADAAKFTYIDGPDDVGDMFERPGLPSDYMPSPYENKNQAAAANGGAYPPDMSLLVKARHHGSAYIYSLLTSYETPPDTMTVPAGQYYTQYLNGGETLSLMKPEYLDEEGHLKDGVDHVPGGVFKMPSPLSEGIVSYEQNSDADPNNDIPETVDQYAQDVVAFLTWASDPKLEERKSLGRFVLLYLFIFAGIVYVSYRQVWRNVH